MKKKDKDEGQRNRVNKNNKEMKNNGRISYKQRSYLTLKRRKRNKSKKHVVISSRSQSFNGSWYDCGMYKHRALDCKGEDHPIIF